MAIVPVYKRNGEEGEADNAIQVWRGNPEDSSLSLLDSFFHPRSLFAPFLFGRNMMDPFQAFPLWDHTPSSIFSKDAQAMANTRVDWWESADAHYLQADLPGATKDDVEVLVENGRVLQISGKSRSVGGGGRRCVRAERSGVGYLRRLKLPANSDPDNLIAEIENGVLTITIPKKNPDTEFDSQNVRVVEIQE